MMTERGRDEGLRFHSGSYGEHHVLHGKPVAATNVCPHDHKPAGIHLGSEPGPHQGTKMPI